MSVVIGRISGPGWCQQPDPTGTTQVTTSARTYTTPSDSIAGSQAKAAIGFDGGTGKAKPLSTHPVITLRRDLRHSSWVNVFDYSDPDASAIVVQNLEPYMEYELRLVAHNVVGPSKPSEPTHRFQTIQAPPKHPPMNVTLRAVSARQLRVRWIPLQQSEWHGIPRGYNISYR